MKVETVKMETEKQVTATRTEIRDILSKSSAETLKEIREFGVDAETHFMVLLLLGNTCARIENKLFKEEK